ncbi:MAG: L-aspartate oxidase [Lachnospiraceae bacterium]|nr:L-aspartate oxidase [Lachnospiraceae bacterium]
MEKAEKYDMIIVGTGVAGLFSALCMPTKYKILMITKDKVENSDSYLAQGGICMLKGPEDFESYFEDTMRAGKYENRKESVKIMIEDSPMIIQELVHYGVEFDRKKDGSLEFTREGAHSAYRILHHEDVTGKEITSKLIAQVKKRENITLREETTMVDLITEGKECFGIVALDAQENVCPIYAKEIVLATGGIGGLFQQSTNFPHITGDSFAIALQRGIELENLQYIQIHPTTLYSKRPGRRFLISESVRGEGAILLDKHGNRFVDELLARNVVTEAIKKQMEKDGTDHVYLSLERLSPEEIDRHFPNIKERCMEEGYDVKKEPIPVVPAQHYLMGGIKSDTCGRTSMEHLFAVGETACNGVHGANRLASNSLLESLVFAKRAAGVITEEIDRLQWREIPVSEEAYQDAEKMQREKRRLVMEEIKRRDEDFYVKWCNNEN